MAVKHYTIFCRTGQQEGLNDLRACLALLISDIEMPEMDGYTLTSEIRKGCHRLKDLQVLLHTSMSGTFNQALVQKVGADRFCPSSRPMSWRPKCSALIS